MQIQQVVIIRQLLEILYPNFILETELAHYDTEENRNSYLIFFHDRAQLREEGMVWCFGADNIDPDETPEFVTDCYMKVLLGVVQHKSRDQQKRESVLSIVN